MAFETRLKQPALLKGAVITLDAQIAQVNGNLQTVTFCSMAPAGPITHIPAISSGERHSLQ